ncbi:MAG: hypothetical protein PUC33_01495 [Oscillospiraceae bacterium]|nr:hypothetical protein [Oscillospiraceae bacterium]
MMRIFDGEKYREATAEEMAVMQKEMAKIEAIERNRPLTESEVMRILIEHQINTLAIDDNLALRMLAFYPEWKAETEYRAGYKVQIGGKLYRALQAHISQNDWQADNWEEIRSDDNV